MLAAALFLHARSHPETDVPRRPISDFPLRFAGWTGTVMPIPQDTLDVLGPGEFLSRIYVAPDRSAVDFFIAYFPSQRTGDTIHSPKNCLPGSGWSPTEVGHLRIRRPDGTPVTVNRYIIAKGLQKDYVLYWYQAHGRVVASEYWAKYFLVADAIRMNRTDGSLVRIITPINEGESSAQAQRRAVKFGESALTLLDSYIPR